MKLVKGIAMLVASVCLSGCFYVQLGGAIGGAVVTISPLGDEGNVLAMGDSTTPEDWVAAVGQPAWDALADRDQLLLIGTADIDVGAVDPAELYLVSATGGMDYDANRDGLVDEVPTPMVGSLRAVMTGEELLAGNIRITALTELAYQGIRGSIGSADNAAIIAELSLIAASLVQDVNGDGEVDIEDVAVWGFWLGEDVIEIEGDSYADFLGGVRAGIDDEEALAFLDNLINGDPIAGEGDWELTLSGQITGTITVPVPETVIAVTADQVPRTGDTEVIRESIDQLVEESGGAPVTNVVVSITTDTPDEVVLEVSFNTSLPGLGAVTYDLSYRYVNTGGGSDAGSGDGSGDGSGGDSGLPGAVSGQSFDLIYCCENTGSPYSNGDMATFSFAESGALLIDGVEIADSFIVRGNEYVWTDTANGFDYALFVLDGVFKEVNVLGIGGPPFYGQWGLEP